MRGERVAEKSGVVRVRPAGGGAVDLAGLLRATVDALGAMDTEALEGLAAEAEAIARRRERLDRGSLAEVMALQGALGELLKSTDRSLRMLRGLRGDGFEDGLAWQR